MANHKEYSSLPLVLATSGAVVLSFLVGWLLLTPTPESGGFTVKAPLPVQPPLALPDEVEVDDASTAGTEAPLVLQPPLAPPPVAEPTVVVANESVDVDAELRKARFAADADLLVEPAEDNALYYYGRVLSAEPDHAAANAELDSVLARIALAVSEHLTAGDVDAAYELAMHVAESKPNHPLVAALRATLDERSNRFAEQAIDYTRAGNDDAAAAVLANLGRLPGVDANVFSATNDYVEDLRQTRIQEETEREEAERLAEEQALTDWSERVRGAIKAGQLVGPDGDSARDFLEEREGPKESKDALTDELLAALLLAGEESLADGDFATSESMLAAAGEIREDLDGLAELREAFEEQIVAAEEAKVLELKDLVRLNTTPARYPRMANQLNITGFVDVVFTVTPTGATTDIEVAAAEPETVFNNSAIAAVEQWTFQPREFRGKLLNQRATARLVFQLEDAPPPGPN